jgi:hypothetical protein
MRVLLWFIIIASRRRQVAGNAYSQTIWIVIDLTIATGCHVALSATLAMVRLESVIPFT